MAFPSGYVPSRTDFVVGFIPDSKSIRILLFPESTRASVVVPNDPIVRSIASAREERGRAGLPTGYIGMSGEILDGGSENIGPLQLIYIAGQGTRPG
jgi:hypothetical protein